MRNKGLIQIHLAVLLFGLSGLFGKLLALPPMIIVLGRVVFAAAFLFLVNTAAKQELRLKEKKDYAYLAAAGVILAGHWGSFFLSIQMSTVAIGLLTFSTFPVFVTFLEPLCFREKIRGRDLAAAAVTFSGVILVIPGFEFSSTMTQGALWGIASGFTFAVLSILNRKYASRYSGLVISLYQDCAATIVLLPFLFVIRPRFLLSDILLLLLLGVVFTGISHALFISGLSKVKAQTASIIASLEPVYGIIATALLIGEIPSWRTIAGGVVILGTAFYSSVLSNQPPEV